MDFETAEFILANTLSFSFPFLFSILVKEGFFKLFDEGWVLPSDAARRMGFDEDGVTRIFEFLKAVGVLEEKEGRFRMKDSVKPFFGETSFSIEGMLSAVTMFSKRWQSLPDRLKGKKIKWDADRVSFFVDLTRGLFTSNRKEAEVFFSYLKDKRFGRVLDVASGSCVWSIPFAREGAHVTALDYSRVHEEVAKPILKEMGVLDNYSFIEGDMNVVSWEGPYDLIVMAHIIHGFRREGLKDVFQKAASSLDENGFLAIVDFFKVGKTVTPYIFDIHMYLMGEGRVFKVRDVEEELLSCGFNRLHLYPLSPERGTYLLLAGRAT